MNLKIKKPEQGQNTRLGMGAILALIGAALCYTVYGWFVDIPLGGLTYGGIEFKVGHAAALGVGLLYIAMMLWVLLFNGRSIEFLIKVDREIKKVTWPAWDQLKNSVFVIIGVIVFFGLIVGLYDMIFLAGIWKGLLGLN